MKTLARDSDKTEILRRLKTLQPASVRRWGRMSAHQMVCHLSDSCRIVSGQRSTAAVATPLPRILMKWIALYAPMQWPAGILTTPELDQEIGGTRPNEFALDMAQLEALLDAISTRLRVTL